MNPRTRHFLIASTLLVFVLGFSIQPAVAQSGAAPAANDDTALASEDTLSVVDVLANDTPADGSLVIKAAGPALHGTVTFTANQVQYSPQAEYSGPDQFSYTVSNKNGDASATVSITVSPVNDPPQPQADSASTPQNTPLTISVLTNDSDPEGNTLAVSAVSDPTFGSVVISPGGLSVSYQPDAGFLGVDGFTYTASDGNGGLADAAVSVSVFPQADLSIAKSADPDPVHVGETFTYTLSITNLGPSPFTGTSSAQSTNSSAIALLDNAAANPYPSAIVFNGFPGLVTGVSVTVHGFSHTFPDDVDLLLVGPQGQKVILMSDAGGGWDADHLELGFSDSGVLLPNAGPLASATYLPANYSGSPDAFPAPALAGPYGTALSAFNGSDPNGTWRLFAVDSVGGDFGVVSGGWSLDLAIETPQITVVDHLPAGVSLDSIQAPGWSCTSNAGTVTCTATVLPLNSPSKINLLMDAPAQVATLSNIASVSSPLPDPDDANNSDSLDLVVRRANFAPSLDLINNITVQEGQAISFTATASDQNLPDDTLTFSLDPGAPAGASIHGTTGAFSWATTEADGPGIYTLTVRVTDEDRASSTRTFTITVNEINSAPVLASIGNKSLDEGTTLGFTASAVDTDLPANTLTFTLGAGAPAGAAINPITGAFTWTPNESQGPGVHAITILVSDNGSPAQSDTETIQVTVNEVNTAPVLAAIGNQSVDEGQLLTFTASASDSDLPANSLIFTLDAGAPAGAGIHASTGVFTWTPGEAQGPGVYNVTVRVSDQGSPVLNDFETIQITVAEANNPPILTSIGSKSVDEGGTVSFTTSATDSDPRGDALTFSLGAGAPAGASINPVTGAFTWTTGETDGPGVHNVTVIVTDDGAPAYADSEVVAITVREVNRAPTLGALSDAGVDEGTLLTFTATASDPDLPANSLAFSLVAPPSGASIHASTGVFTWTPSETQGPATYTLTVRVSDGGLTDQKSFQVTVNEVNQAPVLNAIGTLNANEGTLFTWTPTASDPDRPNNTLSFSIDPGAPSGLLVNSSTGALSWTPTEAQGPGTYPVTLTVSDNQSPALIASRTFNLVVHEVNIAPALDPISDAAVDERSLVSFTATSSDADLPANTLSYSLDAGAPSGAAIDPGTGAFTWTPSEAQGPGVYPITVRVSDNGSPVLSAWRVVNISVRELNDVPPQAVDDVFTVDEDGGPFSLAVVANDLMSPDAGETLTVMAAGPAAHGTVNFSGGSVTYTPAVDYHGNDTFNYTVSDGLYSDEGSVTITVRPTNDPPSPQDDSTTTQEDTEVLIAVLVNDSDKDGDSVSLASVGSPAFGSAQVVGAQVRYQPDLNYTGTDQFAYTITDGAITRSATVHVTITPVNDAPDAENDLAYTTQNKPATIYVLSNDSDVDGDSLQISGVSQPAHGTAAVNANTVVYTPLFSYAGTDSFTYTISDGHLSATAGVQVTITQEHFYTYLPMQFTPGRPDLVVALQVEPDKRSFTDEENVTIQAVVTNIGSMPASGFWVDFYMNPSHPPTAANMIWNEECGISPCYGIAWFVKEELQPGESITLTSTPNSYSVRHTVWPGTFAAGVTDLYVFVDAWNPGNSRGAVLELNESNNRAEMHGFTVVAVDNAQIIVEEEQAPELEPRYLAWP